MVGAGDRRGLREPVALEHFAVEGLLEPAQNLDRHRGAAGDADPQVRGVALLPPRVVQQGPVHRRHAVEVGDTLALHDLQGRGRVEFRQQGEGGADPQRGVHAHRLAERMEEGEGAENDVARGDIGGGAGGDVGVAREVEVGELRSLRFAGGAGGVEDDSGVLFVGLGDLGVRFKLAEHLGKRCRLDLDHLYACVLGATARLLGEAVPGEQQLRAGVLEVEGDLAPLQQHVHRHHDATGAEDAVVGDRELEDVGQHHPDAVALLQALLVQQRRQAGAAVVEFGVGQLQGAEPDGDRLRRPRGAIGEDRSEIQAHHSSRSKLSHQPV